MEITIDIVSLPLAKPFVITGHTFTSTDTVRITLSDGVVRGRGESTGAYYLGETAESMKAQLEAVADSIDASVTTERVQDILPACGARNALDCAVWDYRAKVSGRSVWSTLGINPKELTTVFTLGIGEPEEMAAAASVAADHPHLKIKLDSDRPVEKLEAVRAARTDATLVIDVNQGWSFEELCEYLPHCQRLGLAMIEQPLRRGEDEVLERFRSPIPLGADESCLHLREFAAAARRYDVLNIKLDKCGGLTEGLALVRRAQAAGMNLMVGNMMGSSLSMAPSYVIGQFCQFVDIDGPLLLAHDIEGGMDYSAGGRVSVPRSGLWG